ncbi:MAG: acyltransferase [Wolinella sp.]
MKLVWILKARLKGSKVALGTYIKNPKGINIGKKCFIARDCSLDASSGGRIDIGDGAILNRSVHLNAYRGEIIIGDGSEVNNLTIINGTGCVCIGSDVLIGPNVQMISYAHNFNDVDTVIKAQGIEKSRIDIGDGCWIGASSVILHGVRIGEHSIIGAGAVVTKDVPPYSVAVGVPARVIKNRLG